MRSQDLWLGFCYDIFTATVLQELMAGWLDVDIGTYHHHVDSLHLYAEHLDAARSLPTTVEPTPTMAPLDVPWNAFDAILEEVKTDRQPAHAGWAEVSQVMRSYRLWTAGHCDNARALAAVTPGALARGLDGWYDHLDRRLVPTATTGGRG